MPYPPKPPAVKEEILRLYDVKELGKYLNDREIARRVGCSPQYVLQVRKEHNLPSRTKRKRMSPEKVKSTIATKERVENGITIIECGKGFAKNLLKWYRHDQLF